MHIYHIRRLVYFWFTTMLIFATWCNWRDFYWCWIKFCLSLSLSVVPSFRVRLSDYPFIYINTAKYFVTGVDSMVDKIYHPVCVIKLRQNDYWLKTSHCPALPICNPATSKYKSHINHIQLIKNVSLKIVFRSRCGRRIEADFIAKLYLTNLTWIFSMHLLRASVAQETAYRISNTLNCKTFEEICEGHQECTISKQIQLYKDEVKPIF